ncbi:MAG: hypothetical protein Q9187_006048 [Circinaria calcarea]
MTGRAIQAQWELSHTVFKTAGMLWDLIRAAGQDNVQSQAVIALETLGAGILVSPVRISEGYEALRRNNAQVFERLGISIGLNGGGIVRLLRKSTPCIAGFLFITACKPCYTDSEIGAILFELMAATGLLNKIPISPLQLGQLVGSLSGYCDKICPKELYVDIAQKVAQGIVLDEIRNPLYHQLEKGTIASVFTRLFDALRDEEISKITLKGRQSGIWLVTALVWLLPPDDVQVILYGKTIFGGNKSRLKISLEDSTSREWEIQEWRAQEDVISVIKSAKPVNSLIRTRGMDLQPLKLVRMSIAFEWAMEEKELEATGLLAGALVTIAVEDGILGSDRRKPKHSINSTVPLFELCQPRFLSTYGDMMAEFGWQVDDTFRKFQAEFVAHFRMWKEAGHDHESLRKGIGSRFERLGMIEILNHAFSRMEFQSEAWPTSDSNHSSLVQASVRLAGEALLRCLCSETSKADYLQPAEYQEIQTSSIMLYQIVFGCKVDTVLPFTITAFRSEAMRATVPGSATVKAGQLAFSNNGYVVFSSVLQERSTLRRDVCSLSMLPGIIRWGVDQMQYQAIQESPSQSHPLESGKLKPIVLFDQGKYLGFEARGSPQGNNIEILLSPSMNKLLMSTCLSSKPEDIPVELCWNDSIEALAVATVVQGPSMTAIGERRLAQTWQDQGVCNRIAWLSADSTIMDHSMSLYITMTARDEELRFFVAGPFSSRWRIILRNGAPTIQCVQRAMNLHEDESSLPSFQSIWPSERHIMDWIIIA